MSIPCKMRPVGLDSLQMGGYKRAEFLESTGTQYIITDYYQSTSTGVEISADCEMLGGGGSYGYVCSLIPEGNEYPWTFGLQGDGRAIFSPFSQFLYVYSTNVLNKRCLFEMKDKDLWIDGVKASRSVYGAWPSSIAWSTTSPLTLFKIHPPDVGTIYSSPSMKAFRFTASASGKVERDFIPVLDPTGTPCMFDLVSRQPFYNQATGSDFIVGLTMKQALNLANLPVPYPTTSNTLTVSLPKEADLVQYNQKVEAALGVAAEKGWHIAVQYRDEFENAAILNKYAACVTVEDMLAVNPDYKNDFTSDGEWIYPLTKMEVCSDRNGNPAWYLFENVNQKRFITEMPAATVVYRMFNGSNFDEVRVTLPNFNKQIAGVVFGGANIKKAVLVAPKWEDMGWLCNGASIETLEIDAPVTRLDSMAPNKGKYTLRNVRLTTTQLSTAAGAFTGAQLTRESALHILGILPTYTNGNHPLTIGIHIDHQFDEEVLDAITNAEEKGWTLTVQWNPGGPTYTTPEASAFGLRKPSIYAKLATMEHPDGTLEEYLDWGHYVTNWEENGYQEFASIEEAEEYFNIKKEVEE